MIDDVSLEIAKNLVYRKYSGGDVQKVSAIQIKIKELLVALHDSINSPKGVVPDSAVKFYQPEEFDSNN